MEKGCARNRHRVLKFDRMVEIPPADYAVSTFPARVVSATAVLK